MEHLEQLLWQEWRQHNLSVALHVLCHLLLRLPIHHMVTLRTDTTVTIGTIDEIQKLHIR